MDNLSRVESIFFAALEKPSAEERVAYLDQACGPDTELRRHIERLLSAHPRVGSFLQAAAGGPGVTVDSPAVGEQRGTRVGPYKLLQRIGEGGMGVVWMAEQQEPIRRKVALKIIKPGMDSAQVLARFEAERQALALMDHTNIARVFEAGTTESGRPYFVMELVHGVAITQYCDDCQLTPRQRLELFRPVCQAIQHAHQKGIIHRDVKPSNVLVTSYDDKPVPKVIDFGVAKAVEQRLTERTLFTQFGGLVGTFEYMSPEQAEMNAFGVDTRSDIYSLGVLLYELLTGTTPLERERLSRAALDELVRLIKEEEPARPSVRLSSSDTLARIAAARKTEPGRLSKLLRGEIDWMVMKCLEKDRTRRYDTASGLAQDIDRYLRDEPVQAGPPSAGYRLRKFIKRHRGAVVAAALVLAALVAGVVGATWGLVAALEQQTISKVARADAEEKARLASAARNRADEEMRLANAARGREERQRIRAEWLANGAQIALARRDLDDGDIAGARDLLRACREDLRLFEHAYLWGLCRRRLRTFHVHRQPVVGIAFSPDGKHVASTGVLYLLSTRGELKFWDPATGKENLFLKSTPPFVLDLAFSPDGKRVAGAAYQSLGNDALAAVKIWDVATGRELFRTKELSDLQLVAFSPDGRLITAADRTVKWWDGGSGREVRSIRLQGDPGTPSAMSLSANGRRLAGRIGGGNTVSVWDLPSGREVRSLSAPNTGSVTALTASPDGKQVATATARGPIRVWDAAGKEAFLLTGHADDVTGLAFSADGRRLASSSADRTVRVWDATTGRQLMDLKGHADSVLCLAFAPDGRSLATGDARGYVNLWSTALEDEAVVCRHGGEVQAVAFSPDGKKIVSGSGTVRIWDSASGKELAALTGDMHSRVFSIAWRPDGQQIVSGHHDGAILAWDAAGRKANLHFKRPGGSDLTGEGTVYALAYSPDGKRLASASHDQTVTVWDTATGRALVSFKEHSDMVQGVAFSPDGRRIASVGAHDKLVVWDAATGRTIFSRAHPQPDMVFAVAFSPDGKWLALASWNKRITFLDAETGKEVFTLKGHNHWVTCLAFSADGRRLVSGSVDQTVKVWDLNTRQEVLSLKGHAGAVNGVAFDTSGKRIASASSDRTVRMWGAPVVEGETLSWTPALSSSILGKRAAGKRDGSVTHGRTHVRPADWVSS
jgi:WD40 repeat protein/serine/threonine protein kinase